MTVKELKAVLDLLNENTVIELFVESTCAGYCADAKEIVIGTDPSKICIYGEE
jgi:hypothetical protein